MTVRQKADESWPIYLSGRGTRRIESGRSHKSNPSAGPGSGPTSSRLVKYRDEQWPENMALLNGDWFSGMAINLVFGRILTLWLL